MALLAALLASPGAWAEEPTDPKVAMPILLKVLTYDTNFDARGAGPFVVLVASEPAQSSAREQLLGVLKSLSVSSIKNRPLKFVSTEFKDEASLQSEVEKNKAAAVLAVPGLATQAVKAISEVAQDNQIYTLTLEAAAVQQLAVGVGSSSGKPQILINEKAARGVGAKFENSVLKLAKVIQ